MSYSIPVNTKHSMCSHDYHPHTRLSSSAVHQKAGRSDTGNLILKVLAASLESSKYRLKAYAMSSFSTLHTAKTLAVS